MEKSAKRKGGILRGWRVFLATLVLLGFCLWLDARYKSSATGYGYCPTGATWMLTAQDAGAFWSDVEQSGAFSRLQEEWPAPLKSFELAVRKATGVRPTPQRWRVWMGDRVLVAGAPQGGVGVCVRPGLLMRVVDLCLLRPLHAQNKLGISSYGAFHYAWRDGFLIASTSRDYVAESMTAPPQTFDASSDPAEAVLAFRGDQEGGLRVRSDDSLTVQGRVRIAASHRRSPLTLTEAWPSPPALVVTASSWGDVRALLAMAATPMEDVRAWPALQQAAAALSEAWRLGAPAAQLGGQGDECALALLDIDTSETTPVPELALIIRCQAAVSGPHPLEAVLVPPAEPAMDAASFPLPCEWNGEPGLLAPMLGEKLAVCLGRNGRDWLAASQEPVMTSLAGHLAAGREVAADVSVRGDWETIGLVAERLLKQAGELELVPRMGQDDVETELVPIARGVSGLGVFEIDGQADGTWLNLKGALARERVQSE
jgi:hypothetical protein